MNENSYKQLEELDAYIEELRAIPPIKLKDLK